MLESGFAREVVDSRGKRCNARSRMKRALTLALLVMMTGCPDAKSPETAAPTATVSVGDPSATPSATAAPQQAALKGGWTVHVRSSSGSINPDMLPTPEAKAGVFFDHHASVSDAGALVVDHKTLTKEFRVKDEADALAIEAIVLSVDWPAVIEAVAADAAEEMDVGGTEFSFEVTVGDKDYRVNGANIDAHPKLKELADLLKKSVGFPR